MPLVIAVTRMEALEMYKSNNCIFVIYCNLQTVNTFPYNWKFHVYTTLKQKQKNNKTLEINKKSMISGIQ